MSQVEPWERLRLLKTLFNHSNLTNKLLFISVINPKLEQRLWINYTHFAHCIMCIIHIRGSYDTGCTVCLFTNRSLPQSDKGSFTVGQLSLTIMMKGMPQAIHLLQPSWTMITSQMTYHNSCEKMKHSGIVVHTLKHLQTGKGIKCPSSKVSLRHDIKKNNMFDTK